MGKSSRKRPVRDSAPRHGQVPLAASVAWYVGCPGSGKSTLALHRAAWAADDSGLPLLVLDAAGVRSFDAVPRAESIAEASRVWRDGGPLAWTPESADEVDRIARAALAAPGTVLLVDEAHYWLSAATRSSALLRLMRASRHARAQLHLTTQYLGSDIPQPALACASDLFVFRTTAPRSLELLRSQWGIEPRRASGLPRGGYLRVRSGF